MASFSTSNDLSCDELQKENDQLKSGIAKFQVLSEVRENELNVLRCEMKERRDAFKTLQEIEMKQVETISYMNEVILAQDEQILKMKKLIGGKSFVDITSSCSTEDERVSADLQLRNSILQFWNDDLRAATVD